MRNSRIQYLNAKYEHANFNKSNISKLMILCLFTALSLSLQGCTLLMWSVENSTTVDDPRIEGISYASGRGGGNPVHLIVSYATYRGTFSSFCSRKYYYAIPILNGKPVAPFEYYGKFRSGEAICSDLAQGLPADISHYRFSRDSYRLGKKLIRHKGFVPVNSTKSGIFCGSPNWIYPQEKFPVAFIPYWWGYMNITPESVNDDDHRNPQCNILLLPLSQERYRNEAMASRIVTILKTPATFSFDVIILPGWIYALLFTPRY